MDAVTLPIARPGRLLTPVIVYDGQEAPQVPQGSSYGYLYKRANDPALYWTTAEHGEVQISLGYGYGNIGGPQQATQGGIAMFADQSGDRLVSSQLAIDEYGRLTISGSHVFGANEHGTIIGKEAGGPGIQHSYAENTIMGYRAAHLNQQATQNTVVGHEAAYNMSSGQKNTLLGYQAAMGCSASYNTAVGAHARTTAPSVQYATAVGYDAQAAWQAVAIGDRAHAEADAVAIGHAAHAQQGTAHIAVQRFKTGVPAELASRTVYISQNDDQYFCADPVQLDIDQQTDADEQDVQAMLTGMQVMQGNYMGQNMYFIDQQPRIADVVACLVAEVQRIGRLLAAMS